MSPPSGATATEPGAVAYQAVGDTDPAPSDYETWCVLHVRDPHSARTQQTYLMQDGCTRNEARLLLRAYVLDQRDREARGAAIEEFGPWLRSNYWPSVSRRPQPSMARDWAVRSS